ncbi:MAG: agmatine deiminase family protein [Bacteroidales bacterium]|nr:agmatine deiminase family protein [Bacteroidales bacterium]
MTNKKDYRLPAEWERQECVMLSWPHPGTDWADMLDEVEDCFARVALAISKRAPLLIVCPDRNRPLKYLDGKVAENRIKIVEVPTNDTWARDFGPITLINNKGDEPRILDFQFNGWGLKFPACFDNLVNASLRNMYAWGPNLEDCRYLVLEGGSIDCDGNGSLLTTVECLMSPNRNDCCDMEEIELHLSKLLGTRRMLWLEHGYLEGDDTDSHVDTLARFLPDDTIAYTSCDRENDQHYKELKLMEQELREATTPDGKPYRLIPLPIPRPIIDKDGNRLPATYANFLILNGAILLPVYGDEHYDAKALERLGAACPQYDVIPIDCRALIQQHGSLHCITMQLPFLPQVFTKGIIDTDE